MKKALALLLAASLAVPTLAMPAMAAEDWPNKAIEVLIPANPGGDTDTTSRAIADSLTEILGQPVSIVNMAGGAGTVAMTELQSREADGYTMIYHHVDTLLLKDLGRMEQSWDEMLDVACVTGGGNTFCLFVNKDAPYQTFEDMIDYAKENPGEVSYAVEAGGTIHMHAIMIQEATGAEFNCVDLGSASDRNVALLGNQVDVLEAQYGQVKDYVESGDFIPLCVLSNERNENFEDVPASAEFDVPFDVEWFYYFGFKKGTDPAIIDKFNEAAEQAVKMDSYQDALALYNFHDNFLTGTDATDYMSKVEEGYKPAADIILKQINGSN